MKVGILVVAYNAEKTLAETLNRIPPALFPSITDVFVCDDSSTDSTHAVALDYESAHPEMPLRVVRHPRNLGYGGNQKAGYRMAIERDLDVVVLLHGDGQYAPEVMPELLAGFDDPSVDAVMGSRMMTPGAARRGGMPLYKFVGNKILTRWENAMTGAGLSEWHSGYRAYRVSTLARLPLHHNSDGFDFDTQIILQLLGAGARITEIPIPTYYGDEISHVNGISYGARIMMQTARFRMRRMGFGRASVSDDGYELKDGVSSSHALLVGYLDERPTGTVVDLGCADGSVAQRIRSVGHHVIGVDLTKSQGVETRVDQFVQADLEQGLPLDLPRSFDTVVCADVLEHVRFPERLLAEIRPRLNEHGVVLASVPNFGHWYPRLRTMLGRFDYDNRGILDRSHVRFFTRRSFERLARDAGYNVRRVACTGVPFEVVNRGGGRLLGVIVRPFVFLDRLLVRLRPTLFAYQFLYELRP